MSGRIRTVKPDFFKHEDLFDAERETGLPLRLAFIGLWTQCDRDGRFHWRPRQLKSDVMPYDDIDFSRVLDALATRGFLVKYGNPGNEIGCIPSWPKHQFINNKEKPSELLGPSVDDIQAIVNKEKPDAIVTRAPRVEDAIVTLGRGKGRGKEEISLPSEAHPADAGHRPEASCSIEMNGSAIDAAGVDRYPAEVEELWREYRAAANNLNSSKLKAFQAWKKLSERDREDCFIGVVKYGEAVVEGRKSRPDYPVKHLSTFINERGWEPYLEKPE